MSEIQSNQIYLRELSVDDASQEYCNWLNDAEVNEYLETREATISDLKKYIQEKLDNSNCLFFGIFCKDNDAHIGNIKLEPIDFDKKITTMGILIGNKKYWRKGIGTESVNLVVKYVFNSLGLDEINLGVISENRSAIGLYKKCGFEIYDFEKNAIKHNEQMFDQVWMHKLKNK